MIAFESERGSPESDYGSDHLANFKFGRESQHSTNLKFGLLVALTIIFLSNTCSFAATPDRQKLTSLLSHGEQALLSHDLPSAELYYGKSLNEAATFGAKSPEVQQCEALFATVLVLQGKLDEAEPHCKKAEQIATEMLKRGLDPESLVWLDELADAYEFAGATKKREFCLARCIELRRSISPKHKNLATTLVSYGALLASEGKVREAANNLHDGYAVSCSVKGADSPHTGRLCLNVANAFKIAGNLKEAEKYCSLSETITQKQSGETNVVVANITRLHASLLLDLNRPKEAEEQIRKAMAIHKKLYGEQDIEYGYDLSCLAKIYLASHKLTEAETAIKAAVDNLEKHPKTLVRVKIETFQTGEKIELALHHNSAAAKYAALLHSLNPKP